MKGNTAADRWVFVLAVDKHLDPSLGTTPYAEAGARAVTDGLAAVGYPRSNQIVLLGQQATKAVAESRLRKLKRSVKRNDEVVVYLAGRGFSRAGAGYLA